MSSSNERGMTLVEIMIVVVLGGFVLLAMYEVLITNQRTYAAQNADTQAQQTLRAGMNVLFSEFREISPAEGDIVTMNDTRIELRAMRGLAIICQVQTWGNPPTVMAKEIGDAFSDGDSVSVFFDNDPTVETDDVWQVGSASSVNVGGFTCSGSDVAFVFQIDGLPSGAGAPPDSIVPGAPVRSFEQYEYYLGTYDSEPYLLREDEDGNVDPLVGPLAGKDGVAFRYLDEDGNVTANPSQVAQIELTLRTRADIRGPDGNLMEDSLKARIFTRN